MSGLPQGWQECALEDISRDISYGYTAKSNPMIGDARMLRITDIQDNKVDWSRVPFCEISKSDKDKYLLRKWDLVFARTGATVGKSFLIRDDAPNSVFASYLIRVRSIDNEMASYLSRFFDSQAYWRQITEFSAGIGQPNVNGSKLKSLRVPLAPLPEQKRIADKLDAVLARVDACRDRLDRIPAILKRFRQSVLAAATSGKLTEDWRDTNPHSVVDFSPRKLTLREREEAATGKKVKIPRSFIELPESDIPSSWCWCSIDEAILKITDGTHHSPQSFLSGDYMYVTSKNVREGYIDLKGITYVSKEVHREIYARCDVKKGDVLYVKDGANTGLVCISTFEEEISLLSSVGVLRCSSFLMPKFLEHTLNSPETRTRMLNQMSGNAITRLTLEKIATSAIPIAPIDEQVEIVRRVEALFACADRLEARYTAARVQVEKLTPATLAKAFRGELVPQDPNDESASVLLGRIKARRSDQAEIKPKRSRKITA